MTETVPQSPWLDRAQSGDRAAFDRLVRPLLGNLRALARRLSGPDGAVDELLQESLIRAHRGLSRFRGDCSFRSWLVGILYRLATEPSRYSGSRPLPGQRELSEEIPERLEVDPLERVTAREMLHRVEEAMERLPLKQRTALHLRAVEGWDYGEVAGVLETTVGAARMSVLNARRKLRDRLGDVL